MIKTSYITLLTIVLAFTLLSCTGTQKGAGLGTLVGAGAGAIIGHQSGHAKEGALIGGVAGAAGGALIGNSMETKFCPACGASYGSSVTYCPKDGSELKAKQK
ncbi:MAG: glycine zipper 2TM domain-containing protein [Candidatus Omnitrophota bacterium]